MNTEGEQLDFVTIEGLLSYGEAIARRPPVEGAELPPPPASSGDRPQRAREAMAAIRAFVQDAQGGFSDAVAYRNARHALIQHACGGDELVFFGMESASRQRRAVILISSTHWSHEKTNTTSSRGYRAP